MLKILSVFLSLALVACSPSWKSDDQATEIPTEENGKLYGGDPVTAEDEIASSVVAIVSDSANLCSGVLIRQDAVLTAAHCLPSSLQKVAQIKVMFGTMLSKKTVIRKARYFVVHPKAKAMGRFGWNDLAIIFLKDPAPANAKMTVFAKSPVRLDADQAVEAFGFGINRVSPKVEDRDKGAGVLRRIQLHVLDPNFSKTEFTLNQGLLDGGVCQGDSGGPVFRDNGNDRLELIGIISRASGVFGYSCVIDSVITKVDMYDLWIQNTLQAVQMRPSP